MPRAVFLAATLALSGPAFAEPIVSASGGKSAPLIDPVTLKVNEAAAKQIEAQAKARDVAWDTKIRRTMSGVCRGC